MQLRPARQPVWGTGGMNSRRWKEEKAKMVSWTLTQKVTLEGDNDHHQQALLQRKPEAGQHLGAPGEQQDQLIGLSRDLGNSSTRSGRC